MVEEPEEGAPREEEVDPEEGLLPPFRGAGLRIKGTGPQPSPPPDAGEQTGDGEGSAA